MNLTVYALDGDGRRVVARPPLGTSDGYTWTATWNATDAEPGRYLVRVDAYNGQRATRAEKTVIVPDPADAPTVRILEPAANATVSGDVELLGRAVDGNATSLTVVYAVAPADADPQRGESMEGEPVPGERGLWTATWNATDADPGRYTIYIEATDGRQPRLEDRKSVV